MVFRGRTSRNLDSKSRVMLPPNFREILLSRSEEGKLVLTTYDRCIVGFPLPDWLEFESKITGYRNPSLKLRDFRRLVIGGSEEMSVDSQGRIRLSKDHLGYAGIGSEVVVMGQGNRFELWQPERLQEVISKDFADVAEELDQAFDLVF